MKQAGNGLCETLAKGVLWRGERPAVCMRARSVRRELGGEVWRQMTSTWRYGLLDADGLHQ